jgi:hypothetical protein
MQNIDKLTQGYDAAEDRLFIDVRLQGGEARRLWLTQRLARLLVHHICAWLDEQLAATASGHHDERLHAFEQQSALAALAPEKAVEAAPTAALVYHVDLDRGAEAVRLTFRREDELTGPTMTMDAVRLRQWLGIVRSVFDQADWPTGSWPAWLAVQPGNAALPTTILH